jgi:hypothetical protein
LPEDQYVIGVRFTYTYSNKEGTAPCRFVYWKRSDQSYFPDDQRSQHCPTGDHANWSRGSWERLRQPEATTTVWIAATIREIKVYPDFKPSTFHLSEIVFLKPVNGATTDEKVDRRNRYSSDGQ